MRKALTMLGAIAALAVSSLFAAPAQAADPYGCTPVDPANSAYPYLDYSMYCGTATPANGIKMADAVNKGNKNELRRANSKGVRYFLFKTPAEYQAWAGMAGNPFAGTYIATTTEFGVTYFNAAKVPQYSAIFEINAQGKANDYIPRATGVEVGNALNYLFGYIMNGGIPLPINVRASDSPIFQAQLTADWNTIIAKSACTGSANTGLFHMRADSTSNPPGTINYICSGATGNGNTLAPAYTGLNNKAVLQQAWPLYQDNAKVFAELYSYTLGNDSTGIPVSSDIYIAGGPGNPGNFACTRWLLGHMDSQGKLPLTSDNLRPAHCPGQTVTTNCRKAWNGTGHFPDGNILDCDLKADGGNKDNMVNIVLTAINKLGNAGAMPAPATTAIKQFLDSKNANVLLFTDANKQNTSFAQAGQQTEPVASSSGVTYSNGPAGVTRMWYSVMRKNAAQIAGNANSMAYVSTHELGHVVDQETNQPAAGKITPDNSKFDLALQNDWLFMDYVDFAQGVNGRRKPCTIRNPNVPGSYNGPLIGITDAGTHSLFCSGGGISQASKNYWGEANLDATLNSNLLWTFINGNAGLPATPELIWQQSQFTAGFNPGVLVKSGWREFFSQAFVIQAKDVSTTSNIPELDQTVRNGYFSCTAGTGEPQSGGGNVPVGWLHLVYTGTILNAPAAPVLPAMCTTPLPNTFSKIYN